MMAKLATAAALLSSLIVPAVAQTPSNYIFVTGDSWTDMHFNASKTLPTVSNRFGNPPYPGDTYAGENVPNYIGILGQEKVPSGYVVYNLAVGGNTVNTTRFNRTRPADGSIVDMTQQVAILKNLIQTRKVAPNGNASNTLSLNFFGINDIQACDVGGSHTDSEVTNILYGDTQDYYGQLDIIYKLGIRRFVTILSPTIDRFPYTGANGDNEDLKARIRRYENIWDYLINAGSSKFTDAHPGSTHVIWNPKDTINRVLDNYAQYGAPDNKCQSYDKGEPCLWNDSFGHPGKAINREMANDFYSYLKGQNVVL